MLRAACLSAALVFTSTAPALAQLSADARCSYEAYQLLVPHRMFILGADGKASNSSGVPRAVDRGFKSCEERRKSKCTIYV